MSDITNSFDVRHKLPGLASTVFLGIILAIVLTVMTIGCLGVIAVLGDEIFKFLSYGHIPFSTNSTWDIGTVLFVVLIFVLSVLVLTIFVIVPTSVGGGLVAVALWSLEHRHSLTPKTTLIVGVLGGFSMGWVTAVIFLPLISFAGQWEPRANPVLAGLIGTVVGLIHSWLLSRWLRKRMT